MVIHWKLQSTMILTNRPMLPALLIGNVVYADCTSAKSLVPFYWGGGLLPQVHSDTEW